MSTLIHISCCLVLYVCWRGNYCQLVHNNISCDSTQTVYLSVGKKTVLSQSTHYGRGLLRRYWTYMLRNCKELYDEMQIATNKTSTSIFSVWSGSPLLAVKLHIVRWIYCICWERWPRPACVPAQFYLYPSYVNNKIKKKKYKTWNAPREQQ